MVDDIIIIAKEKGRRRQAGASFFYAEKPKLGNTYCTNKYHLCLGKKGGQGGRSPPLLNLMALPLVMLSH